MSQSDSDDTPAVYVEQTMKIQKQLIDVIINYLDELKNNPALMEELKAANIHHVLVIEDAVNRVHSQAIANVVERAIDHKSMIQIITDCLQTLAHRITDSSETIAKVKKQEQEQEHSPKTVH